MITAPETKKKIFLMRPDVAAEEIESISKVFSSGFLTEGSVTREFERKVADYVEAKHAIAATSCTTALDVALRAIDVKNKEVIVPDFTHPATADAVILAGGKPVLVDVDQESRNTSIEHVESAINDNTSCALLVSLFGNSLTMELSRWVKKQGLAFVDDAACSLGSIINGKKIGTIADITCFSFHPRKVVTTGEGGMITTNNDKFAERCRLYKTFGMKDGTFLQPATNYKLSDILSSVGLVQMSKIEKILANRIKRAKIYSELLSDIKNIVPPSIEKNSRHTFQSYTVFTEKDGLRDKIRKNLADNNIESQIGTYALHELPAFSKTKKKGKLTNSSLLFKRLVTLPLHHQLVREDQELVCKIIRETAESF